MDNDDTKDLDAALAELSAHRPSRGDFDPETRALLARSEVQRAVEARRELEEMPDPPAPEPVEVPSDAGPLLVQAEAATAYVAPVDVSLPEAPRMPTGPVRIKSDVEARRAKTVRVVRVGARQAGAEIAGARGGEGELVAAPPPAARIGSSPALAAAGRGASARAPRVPSRVPVSRARAAAPPSTRGSRKRGLALGAAIVFVAGAVTVLAMMKKPEPLNGPEASTTVQRRPPGAMSAHATAASVPGASRMASSPGTLEAVGTSVPMTSGVPVGTSSAKPAPRGTDDPYADASAPVRKSVPGTPSTPGAAPSAVPNAPSAAPSQTAATSAAPAASPVASSQPSATARPITTSGPILDREETR